MKKHFTFNLLIGILVGVCLFCAPAVFAATTYQTPEAVSFNLFQPRGGEAASISVTYEVATALIINDVIQMAKLPKNVTVTDVTLVTDDLDTGTTITLGVGYGVNADYFIVASTVGQAGGLVRADAATAFPLNLTANDTIDILVVAAPTGGGVGTVALTIDYVGNP